MRITGGNHRGRVIPGRVPAGVRPTSSRVREALFSIVGQDLSGLRVLDAFGGTGLLGFEAWSRGADAVTIVEKSRAVQQRIVAAARTLGAEVEVRLADAASVLKEGRWDLVLLDPPYVQDPFAWAERAERAVESTLVVEHASDAVLPERIDGLVQTRCRRYGDTSLTVFRRNPS